MQCLAGAQCRRIFRLGEACGARAVHAGRCGASGPVLGAEVRLARHHGALGRTQNKLTPEEVKPLF